MLPITLRQLEIFLAIARREQVTLAAGDLHLTQSAVSMALAELERQLDGPLFHRTGRCLRINDRGLLLQREAAQLLDRASDLVSRFLAPKDGLTGRLRVGASSTIGIYLLPRLIGTFKERHPAVTLDLEIGNSEQIETHLLAQALDLAFVERPPHRPGLLAAPWRQDRLIVVAVAGHALTKRRAIGKREITAARWILREPGSGTREVFESALQANGWRAETFLTFGHTEAVKQAVGAGLGLGCLSELAIAGELERGSLVPLRTPALDLRRDLWLVTEDGSYESRLRAAFRAHVAGHAETA